ncbi:hypoxanthine phosphoribosyltransferase [Proteiniclasticum sp. C24MP]|uniref:hypoxanthine phosphoribosyltransferase n=1 Tax=Proteiniclasticum sp. C24MP TaxID=3374101 RepID=UPI00375522A6
MNNLGKIIYTEEEIRESVQKIAGEINDYYNNDELIIISILKGSIYFLSDLTRHLTMPIELDFLSIGVKKDQEKQRVVTYIKDLDLDITGKNVLLLEDVVGTGLTIGYVLQHLESFHPRSLRVCTLLDNPAKRLLNFDIHHTCFTMPDIFVVGYGLDYNEKHRNLKEIVEYRK